MSNRPNWLGKDKPTRHGSEKQEKRLAKEFGGKKTANSGARFSQNDVVSKEFDIEAKTTKHNQFILKVDDLQKMHRKAGLEKIALFIIEYSEAGEEVVVLNKADFFTLIGKTL